MRIETRSSASRLDSGSSNRKTSRLAHDRPADRHALALAAGKLAGPPVEKMVDLEDRGGGLTRASISAAVGMRHLQAEGEVVAHAHMRVERVGLEDHGDAALGRIEIGDVSSLDLDLAVGDLFQPGDHAKQRRFSAARRADEDDELALVDRSGRCRG